MNDLFSFRQAEKGNKSRETVAATTAGTQVKGPQKERSAGTSPLIRQSIKRSRKKDGIQLGVVMVSFGGVVGEKPCWNGLTQKQERSWLTAVHNSVFAGC